MIASVAVKAQTDSIIKEISSVPETRETQIIKGRILTSNYIEKGDKSKTQDLFNVLIEQNENNLKSPFSYAEKIMLLLWTDKYSEAYQLLYKTDSISKANIFYEYPIGYNDTIIKKSLAKKLEENHINIKNKINSDDKLEKKHKKLLIECMYFNIDRFGHKTIEQSILEEYSRQFLIRDIYYEYNFFNRMTNCSIGRNSAQIPSNYSFRFAFSGGKLFLNNNYNIFLNNPNLFSVNLNPQYKKFGITLNGVTGTSNLKNDIEIDTLIWKNGNRADFAFGNISVSYDIINKNSSKLSSCFGLSTLSIIPLEKFKKENPEFENISIGVKKALTFTVDYYFKLIFNQNRENKDDAYSFLKLSYSYNYSLSFHDENLKGNFHNLTLGLGIFYKYYK